MSQSNGSGRFNVREHDRDGVRVIEVAGELDLASAPALAARVDAARAAHARRVLVDLGALDFCDSTGLRALIGAATEIRVAGGRLGVSCPDGSPVARTLDI